MDVEYDNEDDDRLENRESEVIDVEEEGNEADEAFPFDRDFFIQKLREKPQFPPEPTDCGTAWPKKSYKDFSIPLADRLSVHTLSSIDLVRQRIPFPKGCVPPLALPSWYYMPLEKKIPLVQSTNDLFYYTRGKLAEKLHRKTVGFSLKDPYNRERVICEPYTALHDPSVKALLYSPLMRTLLYRRGFINEYDDVLCTLREFNKFRDYLRTLYCDQIWSEIELTDTFLKSEREQLRAVLRAESRTEGREAIVSARIAAAKKFQEAAIEFKRKKQLHKDQMTTARLRQWRADRDRKLMEQVMQGIEDARRNKERLQALYDLRLQQRRDIMTKSTRKFLETQERQQNDKEMMQAAYNKFVSVYSDFWRMCEGGESGEKVKADARNIIISKEKAHKVLNLLEWIESKYVFCYEKLVQKKQIQEDLRGSLKYKARKRQLRLESYREQMPAILEKKKADAARLLAIVRKYAMRWLEKVRARLNAPKDVKHESCWIGQSKNVLDETVKYLRQESGYEKLDDFILNIMKLKKQIQAQIEMEEAEEAAAALLAAENEEGDGPEE